MSCELHLATDRQTPRQLTKLPPEQSSRKKAHLQMVNLLIKLRSCSAHGPSEQQPGLQELLNSSAELWLRRDQLLHPFLHLTGFYKDNRTQVREKVKVPKLLSTMMLIKDLLQGREKAKVLSQHMIGSYGGEI